MLNGSAPNAVGTHPPRGRSTPGVASPGSLVRRYRERLRRREARGSGHRPQAHSRSQSLARAGDNAQRLFAPPRGRCSAPRVVRLSRLTSKDRVTRLCPGPVEPRRLRRPWCSVERTACRAPEPLSGTDAGYPQASSNAARRPSRERASSAHGSCLMLHDGMRAPIEALRFWHCTGSGGGRPSQVPFRDARRGVAVPPASDAPQQWGEAM